MVSKQSFLIWGTLQNLLADLLHVFTTLHILSYASLDPTKFFGCELGAQVKSEAKNDRYIVNGSHDAEKLQCLLDSFIDKFVLCKECRNPETDLFIQKDQTIIRDCKACGKRSEVDMRHKLVTFILKNPPPPPKKIKKTAKVSNGDIDAGNENGEDDDELTRRIAKEAAELGDVEVDDDDWAEDVSEEAVARRTRELQEGINKLLLDDEDEDENDNPYEQFGEAFDGNFKASDSDILNKAKDLEVLGKHKAVQVLVQVIFNEDITNQIAKRISLLQKFVTGEKHQKSLLGGIERLVGISFPSLIPKIPIILKLLYDEDLIEEGVVLKWGAKPSKRYVGKEVSKKIKDAAQPFLTWLEEAEEESSEED
ncbi:eukaryotic translation initiation factor 5, variant 2 [Entomophthora muscae]|uniref:Eukaryotic translation initiation factor 5, variant 2 n=1 Tax=Entomophthora muscae TaxID=34485 RepID=A0ACC2U9V4_9FUNG|nr:eukaryotic translation initiation factor 5, variant 2 [Entomophthora muscae]